ncbi:ABC transporter substrate-binding protein [Brevibacterium linens]|uniref:Substrate-binding protein n=1 Tax=Brevibacterium linens ATCC 9172 TaxID=1255617 RepID=A0A2H1HHH9_BRELN|nr:ABC transporter substrate-binding protein [Brevibacterium linens]SMX62383.1 substrate-binding protein [Brevibacterium linens ATCC 9172]
MNSVSRSRRRRLSAAAIMGAIALTATACGGGGSGSGEGDSVVIGYTGPLSGGGAAYGENVKIGLEMAIADLNADGVEVDGEPVTLELKSLDDKYAPSTAASNAQRLADQDKAPVVVSPNAGAIKAIQQINSGRSNFLISAYTSDPAIVQADNPLTMMIPPNFESYATEFSETAMEHGATPAERSAETTASTMPPCPISRGPSRKPWPRSPTRSSSADHPNRPL